MHAHQDRLDELKSRERNIDAAVKALGMEEALGDRAKGKDPYQVLEEVRRAAAKAPSEIPAFESTPVFAKDTVEASCKYMNYMDRQIKEMEGYRKNQDFRCAVILMCRQKD